MFRNILILSVCLYLTGCSTLPYDGGEETASKNPFRKMTLEEIFVDESTDPIPTTEDALAGERLEVKAHTVSNP